MRPRSPTASIALPDRPEGRETAIGAAVDDALRQEAGKRLLGVILLSDGAPAGDGPPRPAAANRRRRTDAPGRPPVHRRLRPVARTGRGPRRRRQGAAGQLHRLREERIVRPRPGPRRRLRESGNSRPRPLRDLAGKDGSRRRGKNQGDRRRTTHPREFHLRPADAGRVQADAGSGPPARRTVHDEQRSQHLRPRAQGRR